MSPDNDTLAIPALHEDLSTVQDWIESTHVWIVRQGARLVAGVRAQQEDDRWEIGRLMVAPDLRGLGLGRWLLAHAEAQAPDSVERFALFTGARSERNQAMYSAAGYALAQPSEQVGAHIAGAVYLTKPRASV